MSPTQTSMFDWLAWCCDAGSPGAGPKLPSQAAAVSDQEVCPLPLSDDEQSFWQALISPADSDP